MPARKKSELLVNYMRLWPREIFDRQDVSGKDERGQKKLPELAVPGVYVLYQNDKPYYVGQAKGSVRGRIRKRATDPADRYYHLWNYFSAFHIKNIDLISDIEAILIAAMPTANGANPKLHKEKTPRDVQRLFRELRAKKAFGEWPLLKQKLQTRG